MKPALHTPSNIVAPLSDGKQHTQILMAAVFCIGCHQPASLDETKRCEFCRRRQSDESQVMGDGQGGWLGRAWQRFFARHPSPVTGD